MNIYSYPFFEKYSFLYKKTSWAIDIRHLMVLHNLLMNLDFKKVLEIGCHYGVSSTAFIETLNYKNIEIHFCDKRLTKSIKVIAKQGMLNGNIFLHQEDSLSFLENQINFDFSFIDGFHISEQLMSEFELLTAVGIKNILLHDTNTYLIENINNSIFFDGPPLIAKRLLSSKNWYCIEDKQYREKEETDRGLFFATQNAQIFDMACEIFEYWGKINLTQLI
ncbi:MAG: class I SAM-dependent methyltransferase [Chlorobium sp.]|nr:MAG: class I SAM-dependent methyltransferase [Chlorobium sp.]